MKRISYILFFLFLHFTGEQINVFSQVTPDFTSSKIYINKRVYTREDGSKYLDNVQYYDAFGLPTQNISVGASGDGHDLITLQEHDEFYRPVRTWLPTEKTSNRGAYLSESTLIPQVVSTHGNDQNPYTKVIYENSALSRVLEEYGSGQSWHNNGKAVKIDYLTNTASGMLSCRQYVCGTGINLTIQNTRIIPAGQLFVTMTTGEDGSISYEFKDKLGQVVLVRQLENEAQHDTYYIYDHYGMLKAVLPPLASNVLNATGQTWTDATPAINNYAFLYKYDGRNRCIAKKIPGVEWVYYIYDKGGNLILTQDGEQRSKSPQEWTFTLPDALGRIVLTGLCRNTMPDTDSNPYYKYLWNTSITASYSGGTNIHKGYTFSGLTLTAPTVLTTNYYDNYSFLNTNGITIESGYGSQYANAKGLLTGTLTAQMNPDGTVGADYLHSIMYYDHRGRLVEVVGKNSLGKREQVVNEYNFVGQVTASTRTHQGNDTGSPTLTIRTEQEYDHAGRPTKTFQKIGTSGRVLVTANQYNELGQLYKTALHVNESSNTALETLTYAYNIRGWVKGIDGKYFGEKLHYNTTTNGLNNIPQWGGNISAMEWKTPSLNEYWHAYTYEYDRLNRLEEGKYVRSQNINVNSYTNHNLGHHNELLTYDLNGNIKTLQRKHMGNMTDEMTLIYNGNQLFGSADGTSPPAPEPVITAPITLNSPVQAGILQSCGGYILNPGFSFVASGRSTLTIKQNTGLCATTIPETPGNGIYQYDANGRLISDGERKLEISYNHLSLVKQVKQTTSNKTIRYTYDAAGRKLKTTYPDNTERHYIDGVEYEGANLKFISTAYGRIRKDGAGWQYDYFLKDHLGNVRVVLTANPSNIQTGSSQAVYMATMEEGKAGEESTYFDNIENTRADRPYNYPDKNPANAKLAKVPGKSRGPSIMLKVMAGDTISISAKAFYNVDNTLPGQGVDIAPVLGSAIAAMTSPTGAVVGEAAQLAADLGATASQSVALTQVPKKDDTNTDVKPESGIKFVAYNEALEVIPENTGVLLVEDKINHIQTLATNKIIMQEAGFLEIFVDNQAQTPVFFDNLMVAYSAGNVLEVNAYYPYGKMISGLSARSAYAPNAYKYNGKEAQDSLGLGWLDYGARMMEPGIGRWMVPDPMAEKYYNVGPYNYALNNPVNVIDPDGKLVIFINGMHGGSGGKSEYWKGFDLAVMEHLNDYHYLYRDGAMGGRKSLPTNMSATSRRRGGAIQGRLDAAAIVDKITDENGNLTETIKIITHSMGAAYAKGYIKTLLKYFKDNNIPTDAIEFEADFAPFQPEKQKAVDGVKTYQFSNDNDNVANNKLLGSPFAPIEGAEVSTDSDKKKGHTTSDFMDKIKNLPTGTYKIVNGEIVRQ